MIMFRTNKDDCYMTDDKLTDIPLPLTEAQRITVTVGERKPLNSAIIHTGRD